MKKTNNKFEKNYGRKSSRNGIPGRQKLRWKDNIKMEIILKSE
jgi:hypothetical protein